MDVPVEDYRDISCIFQCACEHSRADIYCIISWNVKEDNNLSVWEGDLNTDQVWLRSQTRRINQHSGLGLEKANYETRAGVGAAACVCYPAPHIKRRWSLI